MKKKIIVILGILTFLMLFLTSCKVNWFDRHYDVPWWGIAVPVASFLFFVCFFAGKSIAKKKYVCPQCCKTFSPKWQQAAFSIHINNDRLFRCPHCGRKNFCREAEEEE